VPFRDSRDALWGSVSFLLSAGARLNRSRHGMTKLHNAMAVSSPEVVEMLRLHGVLPDYTI
jgi:hypothetical protein